jgi:hypothetical protein
VNHAYRYFLELCPRQPTSFTEICEALMDVIIASRKKAMRMTKRYIGDSSAWNNLPITITTQQLWDGLDTINLRYFGPWAMYEMVC